MAKLTNLLMALLAIMLQPARVLAKDYIKSCSGCSIFWMENNLSLVCDYCLDANQQQRYTELNLNHCIANYNGNLAYAIEGNFQNSCNNFNLGRLANTILSASCRNDDDEMISTAIDMNNFVGNYWGELGCLLYS